MSEQSSRRTLRVVVKHSTHGALPFPEVLGIQVGDDVEFLTKNYRGSVIRRGFVHSEADRGRFYVFEHHVVGIRSRLHTPLALDIRRVYRDGVEVARVPWATEETRVPLPSEVEDLAQKQAAERQAARLARRDPPKAVLRSLPPTFVFPYQIDDEVFYFGKHGGHYGKVTLVTPASTEGNEPLIRVRLQTGALGYPRPAKIRKVWRNDDLVAVHPDSWEV